MCVCRTSPGHCSWKASVNTLSVSTSPTQAPCPITRPEHNPGPATSSQSPISSAWLTQTRTPAVFNKSLGLDISFLTTKNCFIATDKYSLFMPSENEVFLIYNVVFNFCCTAKWLSYMYIHILFHILFLHNYHKALNTVPWALMFLMSGVRDPRPPPRPRVTVIWNVPEAMPEI